MDDEVLGTILDELGERLGSAGIAWTLGGSAGRRVRGVDVDPEDVDVMVADDSRDRLRQAFPGLGGSDHPPPPGWRSAWLRRWRHPAGPWVEFVGGAVVVVDGRPEVLAATDGTDVDWRGRTVRVSRPEVWDRLAEG